jgi:hypothetical protein
MRNTADVTGGKPIAFLLQSISGVSALNPLVAFYDIHGGKREVLLFIIKSIIFKFVLYVKVLIIEYQLEKFETFVQPNVMFTVHTASILLRQEARPTGTQGKR